MKGKLIITSELVGVGCSFAICDRLLGESFFSFFAFLAQDSFDFRYFFFRLLWIGYYIHCKRWKATNTWNEQRKKGAKNKVATVISINNNFLWITGLLRYRVICKTHNESSLFISNTDFQLSFSVMPHKELWFRDQDFTFNDKLVHSCILLVFFFGYSRTLRGWCYPRFSQVLRRTVAQAQSGSDTFFYRKKQHHKITSDGLWLKNHSSTSGIIMQSWKSCKAPINGSWSHLEVPLQLYQNFFHCVNTKKQQTKGKKDCQSAFHLSVTDLYKKFVFFVFLDQSKV